MNEIVSAPTIPRNDTKENLNWKDNLSVQKLLDVIASIIADEYIQIAKQNKDVFEIASPPKADHNDDGGEK